MLCNFIFLRIRAEFFKRKAAKLFYVTFGSARIEPENSHLVGRIKTFLIMSSSYWHNVNYYSMSDLFLFTYFNLGVWLFFQVALVGSDTFVNQVLRPYVELFSSKPPDWQGFIKFFIIPLGVNTVSKHIGTQVRSSLRSFK